VPPPRPGVARGTLTSSASAAIRGRSQRPGHVNGCGTRCATGASDTAGRRRQPTGLAHTPSGEAARHSNACAMGTGRHPPRSSTCTGPGLRPWPTPFQRSNPPTERGGPFPAGPVPTSRDGKDARSARRRSRPRRPGSGRLARAHRREPHIPARYLGRSAPVIDVIRPTRNGVIRTVICSLSSTSSVSAGPSFPFPAAPTAIRQRRAAEQLTCHLRATPAILGC